MKEEEFKELFASRLTEMRKKNNMTQLQLAEALNYSDKAISKWERAESVPDAYTITKIASLLSCKPGYLLGFTDEITDAAEEPETKKKKIKSAVSIFVPLISVAGIFFVASVIFLVLRTLPTTSAYAPYIYFTGVPPMFIVLIVFSFIWWNRPLQFVCVSGLIWSAGGLAYCMVNLFADFFRFEHIFVCCGILEVICILAFAFAYVIHRVKKKSPDSGDK